MDKAEQERRSRVKALLRALDNLESKDTKDLGQNEREQLTKSIYQVKVILAQCFPWVKDAPRP